MAEHDEPRVQMNPARRGRVLLRHPEIADLYSAPESSVDFWARRGWAPVETDAPVQDVPAQSAPTPPPAPAPVARKTATGSES